VIGNLLRELAVSDPPQGWNKRFRKWRTLVFPSAVRKLRRNRL